MNHAGKSRPKKLGEEIRLYGYWGTLLRIDLTSRAATIEDIPEGYLRDYLGGAGLATRYLYDEIPVDSGVFDADNKLIFSVGPLNGSNYPTSGRCNVSCRSPLTGIWLDSSFSGRFGHHLKKSGFDAIIIEGISSSPVYLYVNNRDIQIRDASHLWGLSTSQTINTIAKENGLQQASCCSIGQAGENLVKLACIMNDRNRAAGRGGAGAIMGSKKLKAIYISGNQNISYSDQDLWREIVKEAHRKVAEHPIATTFKEYGTGIAMALADYSGDAPTMNWRRGSWDKYASISGITMAQTMVRKGPPKCYACPIQCARYIEIKDGPYRMNGTGPEYESMASFGSNCLNDNLESIAYAHMLCNEYGLDTISTGSTVAFAMEAFEKGILTTGDTDGLEFRWGNAEVIVEAVKRIALRQGIGELLGDGVRHAASTLEKGSSEFAVHVKGMELPMHDPRAFFGFGITYATSPRGACHTHGYLGATEGRNSMPDAGIMEIPEAHALTGKGYLAKVTQDFSNVIHSSIICLFTTFALTPSDMVRAISGATGWDYDVSSIFTTGERIFNLQRAFNNRFGITRHDDTLPKRVMTGVIGGPAEGFVPNLEEQLQEYYKLRGWEPDGRPSRQKLMDLGLGFAT